MLDKLEHTLAFQREALHLRAARQKVLANNIANADTPGFKARDFDFGRALTHAMREGREAPSVSEASRTAAQHLPARMQGPGEALDLQYRVPFQNSLDGNTVEMEQERAQFLDNSMHERAALMMTASRLDGLRAALQPE